MTRHFLSLQDFSKPELKQLIARAISMKKNLRQVQKEAPADGMVLGMIFEKVSTRTRVSFEAGICQLGGDAIFLSNKSTQIGRGEPVEDTARVLSSMVDIIMIRTFSHANLERFAEYSQVPVINALTDSFHPCQLLADMQTYYENRGDIEGKIVTWVGDGNNMCQSYMSAAERFNFKLRIACPAGYEPSEDFINQFKDHIEISNDVRAMCDQSDLIATDVWASMGQEEESKQRRADFADYQVNHKLMQLAKKDAVFMHCLPAHRGEEVSAELLEDPQYSLVWSEAENRLHAQKALMDILLNGF